MSEYQKNNCKHNIWFLFPSKSSFKYQIRQIFTKSVTNFLKTFLTKFSCIGSKIDEQYLFYPDVHKRHEILYYYTALTLEPYKITSTIFLQQTPQEQNCFLLFKKYVIISPFYAMSKFWITLFIMKVLTTLFHSL